MPEPRNAREELVARGTTRMLARDLEDFLGWLLDEEFVSTTTQRGMVQRYLIERATRAMAEGVPRYVPVDGHDWHEESPATTPRSDRAPGDRMEGPIAPTG